MWTTLKSRKHANKLKIHQLVHLDHSVPFNSQQTPCQTSKQRVWIVQIQFFPMFLLLTLLIFPLPSFQVMSQPASHLPWQTPIKPFVMGVAFQLLGCYQFDEEWEEPRGLPDIFWDWINREEETAQNKKRIHSDTTCVPHCKKWLWKPKSEKQ